VPEVVQRGLARSGAAQAAGRLAEMAEPGWRPWELGTQCLSGGRRSTCRPRVPH